MHVNQTARGDVHLWYTGTTRMGPAALAACAALLGPAERRRVARIATPAAQREHVVGRALLRLVLSRHADVAAPAWRIEEDERGKPFVAEPAGAGLSFNLSHAGGVVVCAVRTAGRVGVDVEDLRRKVAVMKVACRFFATAETRQLAALPAGEQIPRFYTLWTLREAYLKARGLGLALPLDRLEFRLDGPRPRLRYQPAAEADAGGAEASARWDFWRLPLAPAHVVALAVDRDPADSGPPPRVRVRRFRRIGGAAAHARDRDASGAP